MISRIVVTTTLLGLVALARVVASAGDEEVLPPQPKSVDGAYFLETFTDPIEGRWVKSTNAMYTGNSDLKQQAASGTQGIPGDQGLALMGESKRYGISAPFTTQTAPGKELVLQYELKLETNIDCAGAYLKLLEHTVKDLAAMEEKTGYTIMFGPDKCGSTNKVHLILRFKNEKSGEYKEHHLKSPPAMKNDNMPHLYTLVLRADNTFDVMIDQVSAKSGSLTGDTDWETPFTPPKEIDDPTDKKPADWVDQEKMVDPEAKKPDDWDEDAPKQIEDADATKPDEWDEAAKEKIPDPAAKKPEDWDEDEDGPWEAPLIENPQCKKGCGPWKRPMIPNPKYKGKWSAPMITNPKYKGVWKPKRIENPAYYEVENPVAKLAPIGAVAIEIWVHKPKGIQFDNILVVDSFEKAKEFGAATWKVRVDREQKAKAEAEAKSKAEARKKKLESGDTWATIEEYTKMTAELFAAHPWISFPILILFFFLIFKLCRSDTTDDDKTEPTKPPAATAKKPADPLDAAFEKSQAAKGADEGETTLRQRKGKAKEKDEDEGDEEGEDSKDK